MVTQDILEQLRRCGTVNRAPRRLVIEILCERGEHLTVQDIQNHLRERQVDLNEATVYCILQWLRTWDWCGKPIWVGASSCTR